MLDFFIVNVAIPDLQRDLHASAAQIQLSLWITPGLFLNGVGTGFAVAPLASNALSWISAQHAGAASGVLTTAIQVGNAAGVAIVGVIFYGAAAGKPLSSYSHAFVLSLVYLVAMSLTLAFLVQFLPPVQQRSAAKSRSSSSLK